MDNIEREFGRIWTRHNGQPTLFWRKWEAMVAKHGLSDDQARHLLSRYTLPPRPESLRTCGDAAHLVRTWDGK